MAEPMKVGLIGTGGISNRHMIPYLDRPDRVRLTAVCDVVESLAQEYAKKAGVEAIYLDFNEMLRDADIDAVDICTGHSSHAPLAIAAAKAGKHVIVEKAMAHTLQGCKDMIEAADKAGVTLMVAQHLRYSPEARAVKRFIDEGNLGEIRAARTHTLGGGGGDRRPNDWMKDGKAGGGVMLVQSVHHLDLLRFYVGNVKRVMGISRSIQPNFLNDADDLVAATLEFENGAVGDLLASWSTPVSPEGMSYMIFGSEGTVHSTPPTIEQSLDAPVRQFGTIMYSVRDEEQEKGTGERNGVRSPAASPYQGATRNNDASTDLSTVADKRHRPAQRRLFHQRNPALRGVLQDGQGAHQQRPGQPRDDEDHLWHFRVVPDGQGGGPQRPLTRTPNGHPDVPKKSALVTGDSGLGQLLLPGHRGP